MFTDRTTLTCPVSVMSCLSFLSFERPLTPTLLSLFHLSLFLFPPTFLYPSFVNKQHRHQHIAPSFSFFPSIALSPCSRLSATTTIIIIANHRSLSSNFFFCLVARLLARFSFSFPCSSFLSFLPPSYPYFFINSQE